MDAPIQLLRQIWDLAADAVNAHGERTVDCLPAIARHSVVSQ